jgi:hypothetical protein
MGPDEAAALRALSDRAVEMWEPGSAGEQAAIVAEIARHFGAAEALEARQRAVARMLLAGSSLGEQGRADEELAVFQEITRRVPGIRPALRG